MSLFTHCLLHSVVSLHTCVANHLPARCPPPPPVPSPQVFLADYNVSLAELIVPASDLSQHIRWAGRRPVGTVASAARQPFFYARTTSCHAVPYHHALRGTQHRPACLS